MLSVCIFCFNIVLLYFCGTISLTGNVIVFIAIGIQTIAVVLDVFLAKEKFKAIRYQIISGYFARLGILFVDLYGRNIISIPQSGADTEMYYQNSVEFMKTWTHERGGIFPEIMGTLFRYIGSNRIFAQFLMVMISMGCIYLIAKILIDLKIDDKTLGNCMWIICLFPTFTMLSAIFLREILIAFFCTVSIFGFIKYMIKANPAYLILAFGSVVLGAFLHSGVIALYIGYIIVLIFYSNKDHTYNINVVGLMFAIVLGLIFLYLAVTQADTIFEKFSGVESVEDVSNDSDLGGSSYAQFVGSSKNPLGMIIFTIPRMFFFLFSPVPFQWRNPIDAITFFCSSFIYMISIYYAIQSIRFSENKLYKSILIALLIVAGSMVFVFGWGVSNAGTALRHRDKIFAVFAIMLTVGRSAWIHTEQYKIKKAEK